MTAGWFWFYVAAYLIVGIILKNNTKIGTVQFKEYGTRFVFFYAIPLGGLLFYVVTNLIYILVMFGSTLIFDIPAIDRGNFFPNPDPPNILNILKILPNKLSMPLTRLFI